MPSFNESRARYDSFLAVHIVFPDFLQGHELQITGIGVDQYALQIEYRITPALANMRPPEKPGTDWRPPIHWSWNATDDLGTAYVEAGGAYGASPNGLTTNGVLSLTPFPSPGARLLHVALNAWTKSWYEQRTCAFEVAIEALSGRSQRPDISA